ncbi:hypothetical protein KIN20_036633 [Parelaphostrongylus tenuis]|uniref:Uncharacterized protein n=1 Tax=Parelaphostrongylus tenuis TaxID=148309 RepID=A0AAD5WKL2_PARTN|nr:hypothetical protein KIN20_036633 [Parelaphostrongylus tenuis]
MLLHNQWELKIMRPDLTNVLYRLRQLLKDDVTTKIARIKTDSFVQVHQLVFCQMV